MICHVAISFSDRFYEFTLAMTLVSLLYTLIISAIARMERALPPPHSILLAASAINGKLCCSEEPAEGNKGEEGGAVSHAKDWREIFSALNNLLSLLLILAYILGVIVLSS